MTINPHPLKTVLIVIGLGTGVFGCATDANKREQNGLDKAQIVPASKFDLTRWSITIPLDQDNDGVADTIEPGDIANYVHPDFFYLDDHDRMVFASPNKATTSPTSTNVRSELRYMIRGSDKSIPAPSFDNNFALGSNPLASQLKYVGGKMEATLHVDHVSLSAKYSNKPPAYSVVVGQIHALKLGEKINGFGWGNEPLKISYKKRPNHEKGSVYWAYERNLAADNPSRTDIAYSVWGSEWDDPTDPGENGIALGEEFSYTVNVYEDVMHLVFENAKQGTVHHKINLANNIDANNIVDKKDHPLGYRDEMLYFKAGSYHQCSTKDEVESFRYPACSGTGDWKIDAANGDYSQVTFSKLAVGPAVPM